MRRMWKLAQKHRSDILVCIILAITIWITYFWYSSGFGLNGDDYLRISQIIGEPLGEVFSQIKYWFFNKSEGRPLHPFLVFSLSYLGFQIGGLQATYLLAFCILTINAFLFYLLLKRIFNQPSFSVTGVLAFALFPADNSKIWLTAVLGYHLALSLFLVASHFYLSEKRILSYLLISCSLLIQEYSFVLFFAAPLLKRLSASKLKREVYLNTFILTCILFAVFIIRKLLGEGRVAELNIFSALLRSLHNMLFGPAVSLGMYISRPFQTLEALNEEGILLILIPLCFVGFTLLISRLKFSKVNDYLLEWLKIKYNFLFLSAPSVFKDFAKLVGLGYTLLILAYPLTLLPSYSIYSITGPDSRIHSVAVFGASVLVGTASSIILFVAGLYHKKKIATFCISCLFSLLVGYGLIVQIDYKDSWQIQKSFWTQVVNLCPDIEDGTVIVIETIDNPTYPRTRQFDTYGENSWTYPWILEQIYNIPDNWQLKPTLHLLKQGWEDDTLISSSNGNESLSQLLSRSQLTYHQDTAIESSNLIFLEEKNGLLIRRTQPVMINDKEYFLKLPSSSKSEKLEKKGFYKYLILPEQEENMLIG